MFLIIFILQIYCIWVYFLSCPSQPLEGALCLLFFSKTPHVSLDMVPLTATKSKYSFYVLTYYVLFTCFIWFDFCRYFMAVCYEGKRNVQVACSPNICRCLISSRVRLRLWMLLFSKQSSQRWAAESICYTHTMTFFHLPLCFLCQHQSQKSITHCVETNLNPSAPGPTRPAIPRAFSPH